MRPPGEAAQGRKDRRTAKDIMHVGAVLSPSTEARDVKLAQFPLLRQFNIMAKIAVVSLEERQNSEDWGREF